MTRSLSAARDRPLRLFKSSLAEIESESDTRVCKERPKFRVTVIVTVSDDSAWGIHYLNYHSSSSLLGCRGCTIVTVTVINTGEQLRPRWKRSMARPQRIRHDTDASRAKTWPGTQFSLSSCTPQWCRPGRATWLYHRLRRKTPGLTQPAAGRGAAATSMPVIIGPSGGEWLILKLIQCRKVLTCSRRK